MNVVGTLYGGAEILHKYKVGATISNPGILSINQGSALGGLIPCSETDVEDTVGLVLDTATYSATPAAGATGLVTVSVRPDIIVSARMCGSGTEGTSLTIMTNTAADLATPDTVTSGDVQANDMTSGTAWRLQQQGSECSILERGQIEAHTGSTSIRVIPDLERGIAIGDQFLMCPWTESPGGAVANLDGHGSVNTTDAFYEADATVASGTGLKVGVWQLRLRSATDSYVEFVILASHAFSQVN